MEKSCLTCYHFDGITFSNHMSKTCNLHFRVPVRLCRSTVQYSGSGSMCSQSQKLLHFRTQLTTKAEMTNKEIHSECSSFPTQEHKLHWSKPFLVLHPLKSSLIKNHTKKTRQAKSLQRKIENSSFLSHENISGVYIGSKTVSIHIGQNSPCSKARKSQIKCQTTSGLNTCD